MMRVARTEPSEESALLASYPPLPVDIERAEGSELIGVDGRRYVDLYGGHCVCLLGHNPPVLVAALERQLRRLTFYSAALRLAEREEAARNLVRLAPPGFQKVFFVNSGAEANENALKLACSATGRAAIVAVSGAFHGRTAGADAVTGGAARKLHFPRAPFDVRWVPFADARALQQALEPGDVAAVILEPVQSMAGCRVHPPEFVDCLNRRAAERGALVIADEVQGGLGRCLRMWSHEAIGLRADLITCAKGLGGGFPVGAMIVREGLTPRDSGLLGSTFGGGPLASAAVLAVCRSVADPALQAHVRDVSAAFDGCARVPSVAAVTGLGLLRGVRVAAPVPLVRQRLLERGWIVGGSEDPQVIRLMPPLVLPVSQALAFVAVLREVLAACDPAAAPKVHETHPCGRSEGGA